MNGMYIEKMKTGGEIVVTKDGWHICYSDLTSQNAEKLVVVDKEIGEYIDAWCNNYERFAKIKNAFCINNMMGKRKYKEQAQKGMTIAIGEVPGHDGVWIGTSPNGLIVHSESELKDVIADYNYAAHIGEKLMKHMSLDFDEIDEALNNALNEKRGRNNRNAASTVNSEYDSFEDVDEVCEDVSYDNAIRDIASEEFIKGSKYYLGIDGFLEDYAEALKHFKLAIKYGSTESYCCIGDIYLSGGFGVRKNKLIALKYYKDGLKHGDNRCYQEMMRLYIQERHQDNADKCFVNAMKSNLTKEEIISISRVYLFHTIMSHINNSSYCFPNEAVVLMKPYSDEIISECENKWKNCNDATLWCELVDRVKALFK